MNIRLTMIIGCLFILYHSEAQNKNDSLSVLIRLPASQISIGKQMELLIEIKNKTSYPISVYDKFREGYDYDISSNLTFVIERKVKETYVKYQERRLYNLLALPADTFDVIKRSILGPGKKREVRYQLNTDYSFVPGSYRLRIIYRNNTVDQFRSVTSSCECEFRSNRISFTVLKFIMMLPINLQ